jgi:hypothetical protein
MLSPPARLPTIAHITLARYGPFWAATTLVFITAVAGNFVSWLAWRKNNSMSPPPPPAGVPSPVPSPSPALADSGASDLVNVGRLLLSKMAQDQWFTDYTKVGTRVQGCGKVYSRTSSKPCKGGGSVPGHGIRGWKGCCWSRGC